MKITDTYAACYAIRSRTDKMATEKDAKFKLCNNFLTQKLKNKSKVRSITRTLVISRCGKQGIKSKVVKIKRNAKAYV